MNGVTLEPVEHIYRDDRGIVVPGITEIMTTLGMVDPQWYDEKGKARGKAVHASCHFLDEKDLKWESVHQSIVGYVKGWELFLKESGFMPLNIEKVVWSSIYGAACTLDRHGVFPDGEHGIVEIKTGAVEPWAGVQTAFHGLCVVEQGLAPYISRRGAVRLTEDGKCGKWIPFEEERDEAAAVGAVAVYHWRKDKGSLK